MTIGPKDNPTPTAAETANHYDTSNPVGWAPFQVSAAESAARYAQSYFSQGLQERDATIGRLRTQLDAMTDTLRSIHGDIACGLDVGDAPCHEYHPAFQVGYLVGTLQGIRQQLDSLDRIYGLALTSLSEETGPRDD